MYLSYSLHICVQFNFTDYLRHLYYLGNVTLVDTDRVIVSELAYIRNVSLLVAQQSIRTVQNYMIWYFMMSQVQYMPKKLRVIRQTFYQAFSGVSTAPSRAVTCANYVNDNMGLAVAKLYIRDNFDKTARNEVI